jgi:O-antigen biosynthesis protein
MDLTIVTVNWNVRDMLVKCLQSIFKHTQGLTYEVIVVDNASNDNSVSELRKLFSKEIVAEKLLIIENDRNNGFSKANNQGLKEARGKYVLFMNPDMEFIENTALKLKEILDGDSNIGAVTCKLLYKDKTPQPNVKRDPTFCSQLLIELKLHRLFKSLPCLKKYLAKDFDYSKRAEIEQAMGAFIFTGKDLMNKLNGWDESFWMWWEDLDLCKRIRQAGRTIVYAPVSGVIHYEGQSFAQVMTVDKQKRFVRGLTVYFKKHHSKIAYAILKFFAPVSVGLAYVSQFLKIKPKTQSKI